MPSFEVTTNLYFFTATNFKWKYLLFNDSNKQIIIDSLRFLSKAKRIEVYGFVVMPNHVHFIWQILDPHKPSNVQRDFMKYTAQQILFKLKEENAGLAEELLVNAKDRVFQFWERNALSVELYTPDIIFQKLEYIHNNPAVEKWLIVNEPTAYKYSSARFYETGIDEFGFLKNINEVAY